MNEDRTDWDAEAATFDEDPDHGLLHPATRAAWSELLLAHLPEAPAEVIDLGCGTGSLSVLLAQAGYRVRGLDLSSEMVQAAIAKAAAAGVRVEFALGDASNPPYLQESADVVLCRHVLWALPDPGAALGRWVRLLRPRGRLVLVEGAWSTGSGITADACEALVRTYRGHVEVEHLRAPVYWGREIDDERYLLFSRS